MIETDLYSTTRSKMERSRRKWEDNPIQKQTATLNEADREAFFVAYTKQYIANHPRTYARQSVERFKDLWRFYPRQDLRYNEGRNGITIISLITEPFLIIGGLIPAWSCRDGNGRTSIRSTPRYF